jgi:O-antigen/teichoic acid export membrane protein
MKDRWLNKHFIVLFGNGITGLLGLGMAFIVLRSNMPAASAGIWFLLQSFVSICEYGRGGLLSTATIKFYAGTTPERAANVLGSVWFVAIAYSLIILGINGMALFYLPYTDNYEVILAIKWVGLNYLSSLPSDIVFWRLQADERYSAMFWFRMLNSGSTFASFVILLLFHQFTLEHVILCNFLTNCSSSIIGMFWYGSGIQHLAKRTKETIAEIFHYGKYTFGTTMFSNLLGNSDIWILNIILGPASVAVYTLATKLMAFIEMPLRSFATTGMSEMAIAYNNRNFSHLSHIFKKYSGMLTLVFIPVAIIACICAPLAMQILGGNKYSGPIGSLAAHAYSLAMILAVSYPIDRFNGMALDITHHTKANFYKMVITISVKIVLGLVITKMLYSLYGIIIANYIATIISIIYGYIQLRKHLPHTIIDIINTGYRELVLYLQKKSNL